VSSQIRLLPVVAERPEIRIRNWMLLAGFAGWLVYTKLFWGLRTAHATLPPCPFLYLTGHPCPFCGGTRSFAYLWRGDWRDAILYYPLGPLMFVGTLCAVPALAVGLLTRRDIAIPGWLWKTGLALLLGALAVSWTLKLTVLPN
jgi:hypothetical protein